MSIYFFIRRSLTPNSSIGRSVRSELDGITMKFMLPAGVAELNASLWMITTGRVLAISEPFPGSRSANRTSDL